MTNAQASTRILIIIRICICKRLVHRDNVNKTIHSNSVKRKHNSNQGKYTINQNGEQQNYELKKYILKRCIQGLYGCVLPVTKYSTLTRLAQTASKRRMVIVSTEIGGQQSHEIGPRSLVRDISIKKTYISYDGYRLVIQITGIVIHGKEIVFL